MSEDQLILKALDETATPYLWHPDDDKPTEITREDIEAFFSKKLLTAPTPDLIHKIQEKAQQVAATGGKTLRFRRYEPLDTQAVPLGDWYTGPPQLRAVDIDINISELAGVNKELLGPALSSNGEDTALSRQKQRVQLPSGSPGFTDKLM